MGNKVVTFTEEQLEDYQDCTYFTRKEILRIHKRFRAMADPGMVPCSMTQNEAATIRLPLDYLSRIPELKENPFRERIGRVFARNSLEQGLASSGAEGICFDDFLEMMSVFSEHAPRDLKVFYAFKIYDFDEDGLLGMSDLQETCRQLVHGGLTDEEVDVICQKVLEESDIDGDEALNPMEFEHVVTRAADFLSNFHIRI
ncbi:calcium and integrin-binding family member 3 [Copidosoma floridanum]|uniref:calcium and integrin-binding family member 3 n=1 Tax=Copidosoma floridanum TaxID=29053 RepID=UPI0006C950B0|nr:calcium and integrin-binding family member 3 [Copidosoma floridanum]